MPSRVTPAKRPAPEDCVAVPAPADEDGSDADEEQYVWPATAPRGDALVGSRVRVWWPHDRAWFSGSVNAFDGKLYEITYTDGSLWDEDLAERRWELLDERGLKAHEKELLRVERLITAGELSNKGGGRGSIYARFYELTGTTGQPPWKQNSLRYRTRLLIEPFLDAPVADAADAVPPPRKRAAPAETSERRSRPRRGRGSAELVSEREFGGLWAQLTAKGWKVLPKPQFISPGDPRTWIWCAPETVEPQGDTGYYKLRGRDAGVVGESLFLDKDDVWEWAVRKGLVAAAPRRRAPADSSDDDSDSSDEDASAPPPRRRARTKAPAPDYRDEFSSDNELAPRPVRTEGPDYRETKGYGERLTFRYKAKECGRCRNCLDKPKFGGSGKGKQACVLRLRERAELLEAGIALPSLARRRDPKEPCTICFAAVEEADAVFGSDVCSHVFHRACIEGWARECAERPHNVATRRGVRVSCPNCKKGTRVVAGPVDDDDADVSDGETTEPRLATMAEMSAPPGVVGSAHGGQFPIGTHVRDADDATVRGVVTGYVSSYKEVTTPTLSVLLRHGSKLRPATLTDEEAALCVRPTSMEDYLQARIDGGIRVSLDGREIENRFTCADGTERRQFKVSDARVRCTLCPGKTWPAGTNYASLLDDLRRHSGHFGDFGHTKSKEAHLERLSAAASPRTVLGVSLAQARVLAEAAAAGRLVPVREESSSSPTL